MTFALTLNFLRSSNGKESVCDAGVQDLIPEWESSSGAGNGNPLRNENSKDRGLSGYSPWGLKEETIST